MVEELDGVELIDYGRDAGVARRIVYFVVAVIPAVLPLGLYVQVLEMDVLKSQVVLAVSVVAAAVMLSLAYHNITFVRTVKLQKLFDMPAKSMYRNKPDEWKQACLTQDTAVRSSALMYSFAYNNAVYLLAVVFFSFYAFRGKFADEIVFASSSAVASGLALINSRSARKSIYA
mmetsp:Transcript_14442/g.31082  ORF Transcript_14442/g.31082 Transcript_14442/m.31082 type:complete len:174 (+) Transcript_14442:123-644(+)